MTTTLLILSFIFGSIIGSFINVVSLRMPLGLDFSRDRSRCPHCQTELKAYELIPFFSYLFLRGRCRSCHAPISKRYPLVEMIQGLLFVGVTWVYGLTPMTMVGWVFSSLLLLVALIDFDTMDIYDLHVALILGLGVVLWFMNPDSALDRFLGALVVSLPFLLIVLLTHGMGMGDVKLMMASGFVLGLGATLVSFMISSLVGGLIAIVLLSTKKANRRTALPYGPFICLGVYAAFLFGTPLWQMYLKLF